MGGFFGVVSQKDCVNDLFYGTDYHSHLGNQRGGLMTWSNKRIKRYIHDITGTPFRAKFEEDLPELYGATSGIGCISDTGDQPLIVRSHLGTFGATMVGSINNLDELTDEACKDNKVHFSEINSDGVNPNEVAASIFAAGDTVEDGIKNLLHSIHGSCSMLLLTEDGIIAIRDALGRTPVIIGKKTVEEKIQSNNPDGKEDEYRECVSYAVTMEPCALFNLDYEIEHELGPGEAVKITAQGFQQLVPPGEKLQICSFFWVYFGFPASSYEGRNVEIVRYACGEKLAQADKAEGTRPDGDAVVGIPDSGVAHALGYAHASGIPYKRAFIKYTPTWARSFIPREQASRAHVATMKLLPIEELIRGKKLLFCEDSIVRGTQLGNTFNRLMKRNVAEVHVRSACPPILFNCKYLNFSRSNGLRGLAGRRAMAKVEGHELTGDRAVDDAWLETVPVAEYLDPKSEKYAKMVNAIKEELKLTSLRFQTLDDLVEAIGLPKDKICTYCWDGCESCSCNSCNTHK